MNEIVFGRCQKVDECHQPEDGPKRVRVSIGSVRHDYGEAYDETRIADMVGEDGMPAEVTMIRKMKSGHASCFYCGTPCRLVSSSSSEIVRREDNLFVSTKKEESLFSLEDEEEEIPTLKLF